MMDFYLKWCPPCLLAGFGAQLALLFLTRRVRGRSRTPLRFVLLPVPPVLWLLFCGWSLWSCLAGAGDLWPLLILFFPLLLMVWLGLIPLPLAAVVGWALALGLFALWEERPGKPTRRSGTKEV